MKASNIYIYENGVLTSLSDAKVMNGGLYAAMGYNGEKAGNLFAVISGPALVPAYYKSGKRINVGADLAGMSYDFRRGEWYNE